MESVSPLKLVAARPQAPLRVIAVTSGKGGVGKTNLCGNLAVLAAKAGRRVLILDADLGLANLDTVLGIQPRFHLGHLLDDAAPLDQVLAAGPAGVRVLSAGSGIPRLTHLDDAQKLRLVTALDLIEDRFDLLFIDSSPGIGDNVRFFVAAAQEALLVVTPEPTSLVAAAAAVKVLSQEAGLRHFNVVVNQAPSDESARDSFDSLTTTASRVLSARVKYLGRLPRDEELPRAVMSRRPLVELSPGSPCARGMAELLERLLGAPAPSALDGGMKFLWQRLLRESAVSR